MSEPEEPEGKTRKRTTPAKRAKRAYAEEFRDLVRQTDTVKRLMKKAIEAKDMHLVEVALEILSSDKSPA